MAIGGVAQRAPAAEPPEPGPAPGDGGERQTAEPRPPERVPLLWLAVAVLALAAPFVVALVAQHEPRWYPSGDSAQIELRVRDVFSGHPPLIGLGGRIGGTGEAQGSHPGPLGFYALAPLHRLLGDTAWGFQAATAFLQLAALATALWLVRRRGGRLLFLGAATAFGVVVAGATAELLTVPWNPYIPLLWLLTFVVAVWCVLCDDLVALPIAAFAGSLCAQTHVPYTGVVGMGAVLALTWALLRLWRPPARGPTRKAVLVTLAVTAGIGSLAWLPPVYEQLTEESGNLAKVVDYFAAPPGDTLGLEDGFRILRMRVDPWHLLTDRAPDTPFVGGPTGPGTALLLAGLLGAVVAWRLRARALLRLHLAVGAAVLAAGLAFSRILGPPYGYLSLWTYCLAGLLLLAVGWTIGLVVARLLPAATAARLRPAATGGLVVTFVVLVVTSSVTAGSAEPTEPAASRVLAGVTAETVAALRAGDLPGTGEDGSYLVTTTDPALNGGPMQGLVDELERAGLRAGSEPALRVALAPHRVLEPGEATAEVHLAVGAPAADPRPGAAAVARFHPADGPDGDRYEALRSEVVQRLRDEGAPDVAEQVDDIALAFSDPRVRFSTKAQLARLRDFGIPATVFVGPLG